MKNKYKKIILGTAQFGMKYGIANKKGRIKTIEIKKILNFLQKRKINYLDTANAYKVSENEIGKYFKRNKKKFKVITKYSIKGQRNILSQFRTSFLSLGYLPDTVLAHNHHDYLDPLFHKQIKILRRKYSIKNIGVSVYNISELQKILKYKKPDIIQVPINILDKRFINKKIIKIIKKKSIKIFGRSIFLQGLLFKKKEYIFKNFRNVKKKYLLLQKIAKNENVSLSELSLIWVNNLRHIDKIIIGVDSLEQLKKNMIIIKKKISKKSLLQIEKINLNNNKIIIPYLWKIKQ